MPIMQLIITQHLVWKSDRARQAMQGWFYRQAHVPVLFAEYTCSQMKQDGYTSMYHTEVCAQLIQWTNQLE